MTIAFDNTYARDLPGTYLRIAPDVAPAPRLLLLNRPLADRLGITPGAVLRHPSIPAATAAWSCDG